MHPPCDWDEEGDQYPGSPARFVSDRHAESSDDGQNPGQWDESTGCWNAESSGMLNPVMREMPGGRRQ